MTIEDLFDDLEEEKNRFEKVQEEHHEKIKKIHNEIYKKIIEILEKREVFDNILYLKNKKKLWKEYSPEFHLDCGRLSVYQDDCGIMELYLHPVRTDNNHTDRRYIEKIATIFYYTKVTEEDIVQKIFSKLTVNKEESQGEKQ